MQVGLTGRTLRVIEADAEAILVEDVSSGYAGLGNQPLFVIRIDPNDQHPQLDVRQLLVK